MRGALYRLWCPSQHCAVEFFEFEFVKFLIGQSIALLVCTWLGVNFCFVCLRTRINDKRRPEFSFVPKCDTQIRIFKYGGKISRGRGKKFKKELFNLSVTGVCGKVCARTWTGRSDGNYWNKNSLQRRWWSQNLWNKYLMKTMEENQFEKKTNEVWMESVEMKASYDGNCWTKR